MDFPVDNYSNRLYEVLCILFGFFWDVSDLHNFGKTYCRQNSREVKAVQSQILDSTRHFDARRHCRHDK